ncbi:amino acid ABC transporter permease [Leucobacter sp. CSA1]|uniref:Amino acid ABC transporter permease n=1 Tax=Leucobacter chromiisoli TaxID=2796471 RepID=A0A934Q7C7_9MICO|nr:amino acid ABC transporter permease [Leucobacter chromiisoli]MBK0418705.1 amino acid ABC transporter permease [Leucobacter chromiisoli]
MSFDPSTFWEQLSSPVYLQGALIAALVALGSLVLAVAIGLVMALLKRSQSKVALASANTYLWFFRAMPSMLLLVICWNALPQLFPLFRGEWYTPFVAAILALGVSEAAYVAEMLRSALMAVDDGQRLAARALGMTPIQAFFKVVVPQATRIAIPSLGNELVALLKLTAIASVISLQELMRVATIGVQATFRYAEYYAVAIIYYLVIVSLIMLAQSVLEKRFRWTSQQARARATVKAKEGVGL